MWVRLGEVLPDVINSIEQAIARNLEAQMTGGGE